jgi:hypothetical protein
MRLVPDCDLTSFTWRYPVVDACGLLLGVVLVLAVIAVIGHVIWLVCAAFLRTLLGVPAPEHRQNICPRCGAGLWLAERYCGDCDFDLSSPAAAEVRDLETTERQLRALHRRGDLEDTAWQEVARCLVARRQTLLDPERFAAAGVRPPFTLGPVLERLLAHCDDGRDLPVPTRRRAVWLYGRLSEDDVRRLSPRTLLRLARMLHLEGKAAEALDCYRLLLTSHRSSTLAARGALEAGALAAEEGLHEEACWFLEQVPRATLSQSEQREAAALLRRCRPAPAEAILEALPAAEPAPAREPLPVAPPAVPVLVMPVDEAARPEPAPALTPAVPHEERPPRPPRKTLAEVLSAFMEERNILWGELVGGLLIVGCSIALVISLWTTLKEQVPFFPFVVFGGITAALFGAGLYTEHRWRLQSTSRGLLVIATLLVPLNFLVMAGLSLRRPDGATFALAWHVGLAAVGLAVFAVLVGLAAGVLTPRARRLLPLAVLGASAGQLLAPRLLEDAGAASWLLPLLAALPAACHAGAVGVLLQRLRRHRGEAGAEALPVSEAHALFVFLGLASFALAVTFGFLVAVSGDLPTALRRLALFIDLAGVTLLASGLVVARRVTGPGPEAAAARTAGTALAAAGVLVMVGAVALAWPEPVAVLLVCALNAGVLTGVAFRRQVPLAHVPALACLALGYLTACHLLAGRADLAETVVSSWGGAALTGLVVLLVLVAEVLCRTGRSPHGACYAGAAGVFALASLALVTLLGFNDAPTNTLVYAGYAAVALAANLRWRRPALAYLGLALVPAATLWALQWDRPAFGPEWGLTLAVEALLMSGVAVALGATARSGGAGWHRLLAWLFAAGPAGPAWASVPAAAWRDVGAAAGLTAFGLALRAPLFPLEDLHSVTAAVLAATAFLLALAYRRSELTWVGSALLLAGLEHALILPLAGLALSRPWLAALLTHATLTLLAALAVPPLRREPWRSLYAEPLVWSALLSSLAAAPLVCPVGSAEMTGLALYATWLAGLWLAIAWVRRWPGLFTAFEAALSAAVLFAVTAWLEGRDWVRGHEPEGLADPRSLQSYGIGLTALALLWVLGRFEDGRSPTLRELAGSAWAVGYRLGLGTALVLGLLALAVWGVLPGVIRELTPAGTAPALGAWPSTWPEAYGRGAWLWLMSLAALLAATLWQPRGSGRRGLMVLGLVLLALTVPVLAAGPFDREIAAASALRWGMAGAFLLLSAGLWGRASLERLAIRANMPVEPEPGLPALVRQLLLVGALGSVLVLTAVDALAGFSGTGTTGPAAGSFFASVGWTAAKVVPLVVLAVGLVGHALRERSAGYAFAAGLLVNVSVTGGYALQVVTGGGQIDTAQQVFLLQLAAAAAAAWAIAWSAVATRYTPAGLGEGGPLPALQVSMAAAGNALLLGVALWGLTIPPPAPVDEALAAWITAAGSLAGWVALLLTGAAALRRCVRRHFPHLPHVVGLIAVAAVGLAACSAERLQAGAGYRTALLGWAGCALAWSLVPRPGNKATAGQAALAGLDWDDAAAVWVPAAGTLAVLPALKAGLLQTDQLGGAAALAVVAGAAAVTGVRRRRPEWVFAAGLGFNLAASFLVWYARTPEAVAGWWVFLVQVNVLVSAAVALGWLALQRRLPAVPLLAVQVALGLAANAVLLAVPLLSLVAAPAVPLPPGLLPVGAVWGWLALLLALAAAGWYAADAVPGGVGHLLPVLGLAAGVLAACAVNPWDGGTWLSYHVLLVAWALTALVTVAAGTWAVARPQTPATLRGPWVPGWASAVGLLVLILALRGTWEDPARPYWSAGATLLLALLAGVLAVGWRRTSFAYASGLLVNVAGGMAWVAWGEPGPVSFGYTQALCLALTSALWSLVGRGRPVRAPAPLAPVAAVAGLSVLVLLVGAGLGSDLAGAGLRADGPLAWVALVTTAAALAVVGGQARSRVAPPGLYLAGVLGIGLALHSARLAPEQFGWWTALALAAYVLLTSGIAWALVRHTAGRPAQAPGQYATWFLPAQAVAAAVVVPLTVWTALTFATAAERLAGPLATALLVGAGVPLAGLAPGRRGRAVRYLALALGVLLVTEAGWATLGPEVPSLWLHRSVLALLAAAALTWVHGVALTRLLWGYPDWADCARRLGPVLGAMASVLLLAVLVQEALLYDTALKATPMAPWAVAVVAGGLLVLIAAGITFAVVSARDPLGLSERGRMLYVYAAEALLALLFFHARLTVPWLFGPYARRYWTFIVMAVAFLGVGLSELFKRRRLPVLAEPLQWTGIFLPLLPLLAFWLKPPAGLMQLAHERVPGLVPLLNYLDKLPHHFGQYAVLWFALGALYTGVALGKRSYRFALLAALAGNFGLWALLYQYDFAFLAHPQLWLIPLALIGLIAEHLNRDRLTPAQAAALRYLSLCVLYLSSTADMFITGLGNSVVLPLLLALLSVLGVLTGILTRVRAFLFLGVTFLCLVIFSMIWYAAVDLYQTWVWWVSGIVLGVAILTLFAVFEKRRQDVMRLLEQLQQWQ